MTEIELGEDGVLRWSAPVPPNGVIVHYNVIITGADTGKLVTRIEQLEVPFIDISTYGVTSGDYNIAVNIISDAITQF